MKIIEIIKTSDGYIVLQVEECFIFGLIKRRTFYMSTVEMPLGFYNWVKVRPRLKGTLLHKLNKVYNNSQR
jgi:hypothetical protein